MRFSLLLAALLFVATALAADPPRGESELELGDCVVFREGGVGYLVKTPTYWLRGRVAAMVDERKLAALCPQLGKPLSSYSQQDWVRLVQALPCVDRASEVGEIAVRRVAVAVDEWETPWSNQHGAAGWLFRGEFLGQTLKKGGLIDIDARWLTRCAAL